MCEGSDGRWGALDARLICAHAKAAGYLYESHLRHRLSTDLGAGWSTLNLVHRLRPDFIKLDRELIRDVHLDPVKGLIAKKLLEIGHGMGIGTIVEGIEEEEELNWVRDHGADFVQGFLLGHPSAEVRA